MTDPIHLLVALTPRPDMPLDPQGAERLVNETLWEHLLPHPDTDGTVAEVHATADPRLSAVQALARQAGGALTVEAEPQTPARPAELATDGTAAAAGPSVGPDGESGAEGATQPLIAWRGCGPCLAAPGKSHAQFHADGIRADGGPDAVVERQGLTGDTARWHAAEVALEDLGKHYGGAFERIRRACGYEDPWMHDDAEVNRICYHIAALAERGDQLQAQLDTARAELDDLRAVAAEHDNCPAHCPLCDETLAATVCQRCHGIGDVGGGASVQCPECAGVGRVHEGCAEASYADLVAERDRLRQQLDRQAAGIDPTSGPDGHSGAEGLECCPLATAFFGALDAAELPADTPLAELLQVRHDVGRIEGRRDRQPEVDQLRARVDALSEELDQERTTAAEAAEERDRLQVQLAYALNELDGARQVIRDSPQMRLSWVPVDQLDAVRAARTVGGKSCGCVEALEDLYRQRAVEFIEPIDDFDRGVTRGIELAADHLRVW